MPRFWTPNLLASLLVGGFLLSACAGGAGSGGPGTEQEDAGRPGTGQEDGGDAGPETGDSGSPTTGQEDAGSPGQGTEDAGRPELEDAGSPGQGSADAGAPEAEDAGSPEPLVPAAPVLAGTTPASPANENAPRVFGTAPASTIVRLYTTADCSGVPAAQVTADASGGFSVSASVANDSVTTFHATASNASGVTSPCSAPGLPYIEDSTPPGTPVIASSAPVSPANANTPTLMGTANAGTTVRVYTSSACTGVPVAQGAADAGGRFALTVGVADDSLSTFYASATDAAGNVSPCSTGFSFREDSTAPDAPTFLGTSPASPAGDNNPFVNGTAEPFATVQLFTTGDCSGAVAAEAVTPDSGVFALRVSVADDSTTVLSGRVRDAAGNTSACAVGPTYREDSTPPATPMLTAITPGSPANANNPSVQGTAEPGLSVRIHTNATCTGAPVAQLTADAVGHFSFSASVADNTTTSFHSVGVDAAGNVSACSTGLVYVEDSSPPAPPSFAGTSPVSPANDNAPRILGKTEPGARMRLYTSSGCPGAPVDEGEADASGNVSIAVTVQEDRKTTFYANAIDKAGNTSACSTSVQDYVELSTPPGIGGFSVSSSSPANLNTIQVSGGTSAVSVRLYANADCAGTPFATVVPDRFGGFTATWTVPDDSTVTFSAIATDAAGNVSGCILGPTFIEDSTAPAAPAVASITPSPANNNNPSLQLTAEPGSWVSLYAGSDCTGTPTRQFTEDGTVSFAFTVADNSTSRWVATAMDVARNESPCMTIPALYVEDSTAPSATNAQVREGEAGSPDVDLTNVASSLSANWSGFTDANGVTGYQLNVSTSTACAGSAVPTQDVGAGTSVTLTGLALTERRYYTCVRALDSAGNVSAWKVSNSVYVDLTAPNVTGVTPGSNATGVDQWTSLSVLFDDLLIDGTTSNFLVTANGAPVAGSVSCGSGKCTFTPGSALPYGAQVSATLSGVKDVAGNPMTSTASWRFQIRERRWGTSQYISGLSGAGASLVMTDAGSVYALYIDSGYKARRYLPPYGWEAPQSISTVSGASPYSGPSLALGPNGLTFGVMNAETSTLTPLVYGTVGTNGTGWSTRQVISTGRSAFDPEVLADASGNAYAVWSESGTPASLWVNRYAAGSGWGSALQLRKLPSSSFSQRFNGFSLHLDASGNPFLIWGETSSAGAAFHYARYTPGSGWGSPIPGPLLPGSGSRLPKLALGADGTGVAVWEASGLSGAPAFSIHASVFHPDTGFGTPQVLMADSAAAFTARVGMDAAGNALAIWIRGEGTSSELWAARYVKGQGWQAPVKVDTAVAAADIEVLPGGDAWLVYDRAESSTTNVRVRRFTAATGWATTTTPLESGMTGTVSTVRVVRNDTGGFAASWTRSDVSSSSIYVSLFQ